MHLEAFDYLRMIRGRFRDVSRLHILEFGAHDVNGSPRGLFEGCAEYVGIDPWPGLGVDVVARAQDYSNPEHFDVVITAETLEHDPDPVWQLKSAWDALKGGGKLILTAAAPPRLPHRCDGSVGDLQGEYYANVDPMELRRWLGDWLYVDIIHDRNHGDVYVTAVKP